MITPDRMKAYLDDLAMVSAKHGLEFYLDIATKEIGVAEISGRPGWQGYYAYASGGSHPRWLVGSEDDFAKTSGRLGDVFSLDISTITAHQRIALARSLSALKPSMAAE